MHQTLRRSLVVRLVWSITLEQEQQISSGKTQVVSLLLVEGNSILMGTADEWSVAEEVVKVLKRFCDVTVGISAEKYKNLHSFKWKYFFWIFCTGYFANLIPKPIFLWQQRACFWSWKSFFQSAYCQIIRSLIDMFRYPRFKNILILEDKIMSEKKNISFCQKNLFKNLLCKFYFGLNQNNHQRNSSRIRFGLLLTNKRDKRRGLVLLATIFLLFWTKSDTLL